MVQSLNLPGILAVAQVVRSPSLLLPHLAIPHIGFLDFEALKAAGQCMCMYSSSKQTVD